MAKVIITLRVMPESPESRLSEIKDGACKKITEFGGEVGKIEDSPVGFGLVAANIIFIMDEDKGSTEELEKDISNMGDVSSVEVTDVRRAIG
ncbi:elongation factor 1-beta [Candidatus Woesearchaeota archaeon]|nr:elongation factor 1-beta [Candidatus Woesearchaeota archaeon]